MNEEVPGLAKSVLVQKVGSRVGQGSMVPRPVPMCNLPTVLRCGGGLHILVSRDEGLCGRQGCLKEHMRRFPIDLCTSR